MAVFGICLVFIILIICATFLIYTCIENDVFSDYYDTYKSKTSFDKLSNRIDSIDKDIEQKYNILKKEIEELKGLKENK